MATCANCCVPFDKKSSGHGLKRHSIHLLDEDAISTCIGTESFTPNSKRTGQFLCPECYKLLNAATTSSKKSKDFSQKTNTTSYIASKTKRKFSVLTPTKTPRKTKASKNETQKSTTVKSTPKKTYGGRRTELIYFKNYQYRQAFRCLLRKSDAARSCLMKVMGDEIKKEMKQLFLRRQSFELGRPFNSKNIKEFSWKNIIQETQEICPFLFNTLSSALAMKTDIHRDMNPIIGTIIGIVTHKRYPKTFQLFQAMNSTHLWRHNASQSLFKDINHLGLCLSYKPTLARIDSLTSECSRQTESWKNNTENYLTKDEDLNASMETLPYMEEDSDDELIEALGLREDDGVAPLGLREDDGVVPLEEAPVQPGYTVCWDNVGKHTVARHQSRESINVMHNWALAYIAENRVPTIRKNPEPPTILAMDIPVMTFLPTKEDFLQLKNRMTVMVERILATYVKTYEEEKETAFNPIKHEKWDSSIKKSKIINIGVIDENPSSTNGVIQILDKLHAHVPYDGDKIFPLISWGDALSCERHNDAHNVRSNSGNERDRLEGLEPAIQEFHKRMLLLQDTMNKLFVGASANQKGTLTYLRNVFNHRGVKKDVSESFNKVHEFIEFVTEGYVCLMAMDKLGMEDLNDDGRTPMALHDIANDIVETVLVEPDMGVLKKDGKRKGYCLCEDESDVPNADEPMVGCENHQCPSGEWFHLSCVDLDALPSEDEKWFCSQSCRSTITDPDIDHKFEYVKAVMFEGLGHMARRDAIRENDGPAIISNWKVDMISFHNHHHPKYFILGHRLVAGVSGWLTERLKNDLIWNRTVNYRGGQRNNIEMDMMNEFLNREFKDRIDSAASALTSDVLKRHSILAGGIGNDIDKIFQYRVSSRSADYHGTGKKRNNTVDINYFVELLQKEKLVQPMGCRNFGSHPKFIHQINIKSPSVLITKIVSHSIKLDKRKNLVVNG